VRADDALRRVCAVRKGVHYALEAWLQSPACQDGTFLIAGKFLRRTPRGSLLCFPIPVSVSSGIGTMYQN
jgi:hypothetical protein